jgi:hypothetical protein
MAKTAKGVQTLEEKLKIDLFLEIPQRFSRNKSF